MPEPADAACRTIWKQLDYEWVRVQEQWHDRTSEYFFTRHLDPLRRETEELLQALQELVQTLDDAQAEARYRW